MFKLDLEKKEEPRIKLPTSTGLSINKRIPEEYLLLLYWLHLSLWPCGSQWTVENSSRDGNIRSPYLPLEKFLCRSRSNRTGYGTTDWFQIGKGVCQSCILSPCLFNLYAAYIRQNAGLDEAQAGIKIARRNINNLRYADDTTLMAESEEELKSLLMKVKEKSGNVGLKLSIQKTKIVASSPITSWQIWGKQWKQRQNLFSWAPKSLQKVTAATKLKDAYFLEEKLWLT